MKNSTQENIDKPLYRFVKVEGHSNWFLVLEKGQKEPDNFSSTMSEKILRSEVCALHNPDKRGDYVHRLKHLAVNQLSYEDKANRFGTILIRPIGSYMPLFDNVITEEVYDTDFPITEYGDIVICENDRTAEHKWVNYLKNQFPNKKIVTINFFDLRSESEIEKYFDKAEYITFSTTFSNYGWFEKLAKYSGNKKVIGFSHDKSKWENAKKIKTDVKIINNI